MTKQRDEQHYEKRVDYVAKDDSTQTATGVVMVPNTVDHQGDWERPETIEAFAAQFEAFMEVGEADGGVMHAVWPSDWMSLERNETLTEAEEIGGETVPEGAWVQRWAYHDDELWSLVQDGILTGHSIGADGVSWEYNGEDPDELPDDVTVPDEVDVEDYWELTDGIMQEVSAVDIPAVPDAQILSTSKSQAAQAEKRLAEHIGNRDGFLEEAVDRGHSEAEAERLWDVLDRAVNVEGAAEPGAKSKLTSLATTLANALTGSDSGATTAAKDSTGGGASAGKDDAGGETPDDSGTTADDTSMTETGNDEPPEWAKDLQQSIEENSQRIEDALADGTEGGEKSEESEGGEKDAFADAPEWAKALKEETEKNAQRIDDVAKASGTSQQLDGAGGRADRSRKYSSAWDDTLGLPNGGDA